MKRRSFIGSVLAAFGIADAVLPNGENSVPGNFLVKNVDLSAVLDCFQHEPKKVQGSLEFDKEIGNEGLEILSVCDFIDRIPVPNGLIREIDVYRSGPRTVGFWVVDKEQHA